jgi:hypothetical protein
MRKKQIDDERERKPEADDGCFCPHCGRPLIESSRARRSRDSDDFARYFDIMEKLQESGD